MTFFKTKRPSVTWITQSRSRLLNSLAQKASPLKNREQDCCNFPHTAHAQSLIFENILENMALGPFYKNHPLNSNMT